MENFNQELGNKKENAYITRQLQQRQQRQKMVQDKEKFLKDTELIEFEDIMLFTYPNGFNKNNIFHLCIKDNNNMISFIDKETKVPASILEGMEINQIKIENFDANGELYDVYTNSVCDIVNSAECAEMINDKEFNFLADNFLNKPLPMLRYKELREIDKKFVDLQLAELNKTNGQTTFKDFEK